MDNETQRDHGWTIIEAIENALSPELSAQLNAAERAAASVRPARRYVEHPWVSFDPWRLQDNPWTPHRRRPRPASQEPQYATARQNACEELRRQLVSGVLVAWGRFGSTMAEPRRIPASAWKVLRFYSLVNSIVKEGKDVRIYDVRIYFSEDEPQVVADVFHMNSRGSVVLRSNTRNGELGSGSSKKSMRVVTSARARNECRQWLIAKMKASPGERFCTKDSFWIEAHGRWLEKLSKRAFLGAWDEAKVIAKAPAWGAAGAPKKKSPR